MRRALFLDRDGIINRMVEYPGEEPFDSPRSPEDVVLIKGIEKIIAWANKKRLPVIEITNQPGVAKGKISQKKSDAIEFRIHKLLREKGVKIDRTYICPHHPKGVVIELTKVCNCRKPKPGLLLQAAKEQNIDLRKSLFLGDGAPDIEAGRLAGCKTVILLHDQNLSQKIKEAKKSNADYQAVNLNQAFGIVTTFFKSI